MPQETKSHVDREHPVACTRGVRIEAGDPRLSEAIGMAVDYRGDVTITRASTGRTIEGYLFDYRPHADADRAVLRLIPRDADERIAIPLSEIAALEFTGRDTAAGKSFETWMKKYVRKKLAGEEASIEADSLEDE